MAIATEKEIIIVDQDDVISVGGFLYLINKFLGTNYTYADFKDFYMQDIIPCKEDFFEWFQTQNMYDYCELTPGCAEVLKELNEVYRLYIGTSYIFPEIADKCGYIVMQKFEYLQKNLPFISPYQYIFLSNKGLLRADIRIDDRIDNLDDARVKLLFSAYHNLEYSNQDLQSMGIERMNSWFDVKRRLLKK